MYSNGELPMQALGTFLAIDEKNKRPGRRKLNA